MSKIIIEIVSASCKDIVCKLTALDICIYSVVFVDDLTMRFAIRRNNWGTAKNFLESNDCKYRILVNRKHFFAKLLPLNRPVLLIGVAIIIFLIIYLPTKVLFVGVVGNENVPTSLILEKAELCGISFGASRDTIRSEKVKNKLLAEIPALQWAGINTYGCLAMISVEEKDTLQNETGEYYNTNVVAAKDGIVAEISVLRGNPLCSVGQVVTKGQVLVSGYTDYGIVMQLTGADAEIFGYTNHKLNVKTLAETIVRQQSIKKDVRFSLLLGKKLINFDKDSGISDMKCDRMYEEYYLVLPGGLQLPIGVVKETVSYYDTVLKQSNDPRTYHWLTEYAVDYLHDDMIAGTILTEDKRVTIENGVCSLYGIYRCRELISRIHYEEILRQYEQRS